MITGGTDGGGAGGSGGTSASGGAGGTSGGSSYCTASDCGSDQPISGPGGTDCYCDDLCHGNNDCCPDKVSVCGQGTGGSGGGTNIPLPTGCVTASSFATPCNPVTNEACTGSGAACDTGQTGVECYGSGNTEAAGAPCGGQGTTKGKYCIPTYHCDGESSSSAGTCKKFCCSSSDCNGGTCKAFDAANIGTLGVCEGGSTDGGGGTGGTGGTDAGSDAASDATAD